MTTWEIFSIRVRILLRKGLNRKGAVHLNPSIYQILFKKGYHIYNLELAASQMIGVCTKFLHKCGQSTQI